MRTTPLVLFHICCAVIGLLSGYLSMFFRKGSGLHRAAGDVFVVAMLGMGASAAYIATFQHPIRANVIAGLLTIYVVSTGWWAGRRAGSLSRSSARSGCSRAARRAGRGGSRSTAVSVGTASACGHGGRPSTAV